MRERCVAPVNSGANGNPSAFQPCVLRQAQDEDHSLWPRKKPGLDLPHPELVEGRTAFLQHCSDLDLSLRQGRTVRFCPMQVTMGPDGFLATEDVADYAAHVILSDY